MEIDALNDSRLLVLPIAELRSYLLHELQVISGTEPAAFAGDDNPSAAQPATSDDADDMAILKVPIEQLRQRIADELAEATRIVEADLAVETLATGEFQASVPDMRQLQQSVRRRCDALQQLITNDPASADQARQRLLQAQAVLLVLQRRELMLLSLGREIIRRHRPFLAGETARIQPVKLESCANIEPCEIPLLRDALKTLHVQTPQAVFSLYHFWE